METFLQAKHLTQDKMLGYNLTVISQLTIGGVRLNSD